MNEIKICIFVLENTKGLLSELDKVAIDVPSFINAKGLFIATFTTTKSIDELKQYFIDKGRIFMLFKIDNSTTAFNFFNKKIEMGLFKLMDENDSIDWGIDEFKNDKFFDSELTDINIQKMTKDEKEAKLNELIDKGINNLTEEEKRILNLLVM